jgi:hypothetical protein
MSTSRRVTLAILAIVTVAIPAPGAGLSIDSMDVVPAGSVVGWGSPFTVTLTVSGGTPPYTYSWTQNGGSPIAISGAETAMIAGTTPTRVENLTARDRTVWQVTGWSTRDTSIEFWCVVSDSLSDSVSESVIITMTPFASIGEGFVGLGTEVVLNGADQNLYDWSLTSAPSGSLTGIAVGSADTQAPYFIPDVAGYYVTSESYSGETVTVIADEWRGVGTIDGSTPFAIPRCLAPSHPAQ